MNPALNLVVYNEATRIVGCLTHASMYCNELVVVDQGSDDGTGDIARDLGATVVPDECRGYSELSFGLAAEHTSSPYILILDADETLLKVDELVALDERWDAAWLARATYVDGVRFKPGTADRQLRYYRRGMPEYPIRIHTFLRMPTASTVYRSSHDPWILHEKTGREQELDDMRYRKYA